MSFLNGTQIEILAPKALRKGDVIETPKGRYLILANKRSKGQLRYSLGAFSLIRPYTSIARAMGI